VPVRLRGRLFARSAALCRWRSLALPMGSVLPTPITAKESGWEPPSGPLQLSWASSCMQGWRTGMEDAHICLPALANEGPWMDVAMFGVMDGHCGEQVAKFCERHLPEEVRAHPSQGGKLSQDEMRLALTGAFHRIDDLLRDVATCMPELRALTNASTHEMGVRGFAGSQRTVHPNQVGCTCCICCITAEQLVTANAGDSRAVVCNGGTAIALSVDHKPNMPSERRRIIAAGGCVQEQSTSCGTQYRVNGNLNLSRALGDLEYKRDPKLGPEAQMISGTPEVKFYDRTPDDEFLIICCDGVWDVKTNQEVVDFVRSRLPPPSAEPHTMAIVLEELLDSCISPDLARTKGLGGDNMTAVLVRLPAPGTPPPAQCIAATRPRPAPSAVENVGAATKVELAAKLLSVRLKSRRTEKPGGCVTFVPDGALVVRFELPHDREGNRRVEVWVREASAEIEVAMTSRAPRAGAIGSAANGSADRFSLAAYLPDGAELDLPCCGEDRPLVKLHTRSRQLVVHIPLRTCVDFPAA